MPPGRGVVGRTKSITCGAGAASHCYISEGGLLYVAMLQEGVFPLKKTIRSIRLSVQNFGSVQTVAVCGMLLALRVILGFFTVNVSILLKIGFAFLPVAVAGMLFGPVVGGTIGAAGDIVAYFIQPTGPYFPGFTVSSFVAGFLYGMVLYRRRISFVRSFSAKAIVTAAVSLLLNPLWLSMLYGKAFFTILSFRITANLVSLPVNAVLLFAVLKIIERSRVLQPKRNY